MLIVPNTWQWCKNMRNGAMKPWRNWMSHSFSIDNNQFILFTLCSFHLEVYANIFLSFLELSWCVFVFVSSLLKGILLHFSCKQLSMVFFKQIHTSIPKNNNVHESNDIRFSLSTLYRCYFNKIALCQNNNPVLYTLLSFHWRNIEQVKWTNVCLEIVYERNNVMKFSGKRTKNTLR